MFGIGIMELAVIAVVVLLFVGPDRLPQVARDAGKFFVKIRRITNDVRSTVDGFIKDAESELLADERKKLKSLIESELGNQKSWIDEHNENHDANHSHHDTPEHAVAHAGDETLPENTDGATETEKKEAPDAPHT